MRPLFFGCVLVAAPFAFAQTVPVWWTTQGALSGAADDYAAANIGQLKYMASLAVREMEGRLGPSGAGTDLRALVNSWTQPLATRDDFAAVNSGQLKTVAKLFYDRLGQPYPWSQATTDDDDYALVNLGQLKYAFKFKIAGVGDDDADGLLDSWEVAHFGGTGVATGQGDSDGDFLSNRGESLLGTKPNSAADTGPDSVSQIAMEIHSP